MSLSRKNRLVFLISIATVIMLGLWGCSSSRHVPEGSYLLDNVRIEINDSTNSFDAQSMQAYLRQLPNHKMLWSLKFRLGFYNMSGNDTSKWYNRWVRKLGEAPVIWDSTLMRNGVEQLRKAMVNKGFLEAKAYADTTRSEKDRKINIEYRLEPGQPHIIRSVDYVFADSVIRDIVMKDSSSFPAKTGAFLDRDMLEVQRAMIVDRLRNNGYYDFAKESVTFTADTTEGCRLTDLTMKVGMTMDMNRNPETYTQYLVRKIIVVTNYDPATDVDLTGIHAVDTLAYKDLVILYGNQHYLRPSVLYDACHIRAGEFFKQKSVELTYQYLSRYQILKFINIRFIEAEKLGDMGILDCYILLTPGRSQSVSFELEGTNSEGDLGVAAAATYTHRNIGKGSETLTAKVRGAYESLSGNLDGLLHNRYMEYSLDLGVNFPQFLSPFLSDRFKKRVNATTEVNAALTYQERPEYTRILSNLGWSYKWTHSRNHNRYIFTPLDINYVYLPESTYDFIDQIAPDNPLLRYSYEDHFIMRSGFSFYHSNKRGENSWNRVLQKNIYTIRANAEIAGNLLYLFNTIFSHRKESGDPYKIFGIHYSQYFKINSDFTFLQAFDLRNAMAFHAGFGIGYPYGNSAIMPFEKRFYGGGANGVRGWDVRTLGPGSFPGNNSVSDFINQCGDIRLDLSVEYRAKLFWILELGTFIDAGNIWTIHNYSNQPGGMFHFNTFYKQIAAAYGLGIRLDFSYFLLRFDLGMKAHNPAMGQKEWPLFHPNWHRDSSFHFSIGYPF